MLIPVVLLGEDATVQIVDSYVDGTIWAAITDNLDRRAHICLDGRAGSRTRNRLFDQARHPDKREAVLLEPGSVGEARALAILRGWLDQGTLPEDPDILARLKQIIREVVDRVSDAGDQANQDLSENQQRELDRRMADLDANPNIVLTWEQIKAHVLRPRPN